MFKILSVTNRHLCREPLAVRIRRIARSGIDGIILREKDLSEEEYQCLAAEVMEICRKSGTMCVLHTFADTAEKLGAEALHLPLPILKNLPQTQREKFAVLGASCHSLEDVQEAARFGCTYVTLGHIFVTDCKKGLPPRGIDLLREVCGYSPIPVYAIGGIRPENLFEVQAAGAAGACIMSGLLCCPDPEREAAALRQALNGG